MFWRQEREKRSIDDILTPKEKELSVDADEKVKNDGGETESDKNVQESHVDSIKPLDCFGMEEGKTEKWLMKCVKFWYCFMSFMWFLFGATTFAPVIYIRNKVDAIFKNKTRALLCAILLYGIFVSCLLLLIAVRRNASS